LPTGFAYDKLAVSRWTPTHESGTIANFFETFSRLGSASEIVRMFRNEGVLFPSRLRVGDTVAFWSLAT